MPSVFAVFLACLVSLSGALADTQTTISTQRPVHTYSIVARDPETGRLGVAVQSHWFSVGTLVPWARAGVGAVATQSFVDVRYGTEGLALMQDGKPAQQVLQQLIRQDPTPEVRQVGMIDASGGNGLNDGGSAGGVDMYAAYTENTGPVDLSGGDSTATDDLDGSNGGVGGERYIGADYVAINGADIDASAGDGYYGAETYYNDEVGSNV